MQFTDILSTIENWIKEMASETKELDAIEAIRLTYVKEFVDVFDGGRGVDERYDKIA